MKFLLIFLSITLFLVLLFPCSFSITSPDFQTKHVFLLAGQSNMVGRGGVNKTNIWDKYVPRECSPSPKIFRLNNDLQWEEAVEPLHRGIENFAPGVGPGMPFSNRLLKRTNPFLVGDIGLVPAARGETNITTWQRGGFLYNRLLQRADAAVRGGGTIRALLWYQGESDTASEEAAVFYEGRLIQFFNDIRSDLGLLQLPIIQVALNPGVLNATYVEIVRKVQLELDMPFVKSVDAKGLALDQGDRVHLTTDAQVRLGEMLADAFIRLLSNCSAPVF